MKKFEELQLFEINLKNFEKYLAHPPDESLREHVQNTHAAFLALCKDGLEPLIDSQIKECFKKNHEIVKEFILNLICLHDLGKLNPAFQKIKLNNPIDPTWDDKNTRHSELGWHLFLLAYGRWIEENIMEDEDLLSALVLTTVIAGHHTYAWGSVDELHRPTEEQLEFAEKVVNSCGWKIDITQKDKNRIIHQIKIIIEQLNGCSALFALYKTIYSSLILSDSIATGAGNASDISSMSHIERSDIKRWREAFDSSQHMRNFYQRRAKLERQGPKDISNINDLRNKILFETSKNMLRGLREGKRIFYLEAPTGAGKTNCAINLALSVLENDSTIKRLFFVFPFLNLIEQNIEVVRESISALSDDILEVHSLAEWRTSEEEHATEYDQRLFLDGKITIISSVTLFETLGSSRKAQNYKICNLSNSVIVLDEIQSIDDRKWTYLTFLLETFASLNNCYFILMSATLPRIDQLQLIESDCDFVELLPEFKEYQRHPCFAKRVNITVNEDINTVEELVHLVKKILSNVSKPTKLLIVVNTIRRSREVFHALPDSFETATGPHKFEKKLLNSELLPHIKRNIIQKAKETHDNDFILVSTQCIEAGVDADFDVGIRDFAVLDSIEQVAGRVNRENEKGPSMLYVTNLLRNDKKDAENVYKGGRRWKALCILESNIENILKSRDYSTYYEKLVEINKEMNKRPVGVDVKGRTETCDAVSLRLHSEKIKNFHVIEDNMKESYFIMVDVPKSEFSPDETKQIEFAIENDMVKAEKVWREYLRIKELRGRDGMIKMAAFSPILSKFIASKHSKDFMGKPLELLSDFKDIYDLESGFSDSDNIF